MAASTSTSGKTLLILGKAGSGKSSTANSILGEDGFSVSHSFKSSDQDFECQSHTNQQTNNLVICAPDLEHCEFYQKGIQSGNWSEEIKSWMSKAKSRTLDAVVMVTRCDQRFTDSDFESYKKLRNIEPLKTEMEKMVIVFTMGDRLCGRDLRQELESKGEDLKNLREVWKDAQFRYVVFNNKADKDTRRLQVDSLLYIVKTGKPHPFPQQICRLLVITPRDMIEGIRRRLREQSSEMSLRKAGDAFLTTTIPGDAENKFGDIAMEIVWALPTGETDGDDLPVTKSALCATSPGPHAILCDLHTTQSLPSAAKTILLTDDIREIPSRTISPFLFSKICDMTEKKSGKACGQIYQSSKIMQFADEICSKLMNNSKPGKDMYEDYLKEKCKMSASMSANSNCPLL